MAEEAILEIDGTSFSGWEKVSIVRTMETLAATFTLEMVEGAGVTAAQVTPGKKVRLFLADTKQGDEQDLLVGWIDARARSISGDSTSLSISGRDVCADLVDCAAVHTSSSWTKATLAQIAEDVCKPFGIYVDSRTDDRTPFDKVVLQSGESAFDLIERLSRQRGVLPLSNRFGDLVLTYAEETGGNSVQRLVQGVNLLELSEEWDDTGRFSKYTVKGQTGGDGSPWGSSEAVSLFGKATDAAVSRYRPTVIMAEGKITRASVSRRAAWEAQVRAGRAKSYTCRVQGWWQSPAELVSDSRPWEVNNLVDLEAFGETQQLLITGTAFTLDNSGGRYTELTLKSPDTYRKNPDGGTA